MLDWPYLLKGIQLLLGVQLIVVAMLHFGIKSEKVKILLALLCLINGLWFFKHVFYGLWNNDLFLFLLIGPGKPIYVGAILLLYFRSFSRSLAVKEVVLYLILPTVYYLILVWLRFTLSDIDDHLNLKLSIGFSVATFLIFWFYFFITRKEMSNQVKQVLIPKAYKRLKVLFISLYFFLLQIPVWDICEKLNHSSFISSQQQSVFNSLYVNFFRYAGYHASYIYLHILGYFIFLYAISELPYLKKMLLPKETTIPYTLPEKRNELALRMKIFFHEEKSFVNPEITMESSARAMGITKAEFVSLFKYLHRGSFKDYLNRLRVEEFKRLIVNGEDQKFDLVGIASTCGFNSKATFFRVFKSMEGVTPNEYKDSILITRKGNVR